MNEIDENGLLPDVLFHNSPNCDERPVNTCIDLLVIHNISLPPKYYGGTAIDELFTNRLDYSAHPYFQTLIDLKVSAHILIRRDGQIIQYVPFNKRAWHAGISSFGGRTQCNNFSIGIELEGADDVPYTNEQYQQLAQLSALLLKHYPDITHDRIVGHSDIAPGRKTDPGSSFDWTLYFKLLNNYSISD